MYEGNKRQYNLMFEYVIYGFEVEFNYGLYKKLYKNIKWAFWNKSGKGIRNIKIAWKIKLILNDMNFCNFNF